MIHTILILIGLFLYFILLFTYISVVLDNIKNIKNDIHQIKMISKDILKELEKINFNSKINKGRNV